MSNNVLLTPKVYAKLVMMDLGGDLTIASNMSPAITPEFAKKQYKVGDTVQFYKPYRFVGGDGIGWEPEPIVDQVGTASVRQVSKVHYQMGSIERTLDVREAMRLYTGPTKRALANKINNRSAIFAANNALNSVGTPGTPPTTEATYLAAGDILCELGLPEGEKLKLFINRKMSTAYIGGTKALYNPAGALSKTWMKGEMQDSLGYEIIRDQTIATRVNGTFTVVGLVNTAQTADGGNNATMSLTVDGMTASFKQGDRFTLGSDTSATVGGVESVHPQTRVSTGRQQVFTIQQDSGANPTSLVIAPAITPSGQYQNVNSGAVDNAIITMIGTTGLTGITCGLLMHESAFGFISVPMWNPPSNGVIAAEVITDPETGLNLNMVKYFDGDNREEKTRFDCLWDNCNLYREMAVVIQA
jgi:P22 coat protein - gene protein 5